MTSSFRALVVGAGLLLAALSALAQTQQPVMPTDTPARLPTQAVPTITNNAGPTGAGARDGRDGFRDNQSFPDRGRPPGPQGARPGAGHPPTMVSPDRPIARGTT